ncbi:protein-disulfide reductase DsbD [Rhizobium sp. P38BS-XIX]|uniref:protein-disulfide reductase DsbD n=1 Tax=Rhizobium sp. P38BS-XIX TaxID=2726740 RepID=UPI0014566BA6|nr:protein-disulfide reductase DsbD [Rhizobium sp. P38BS-XIX]NLS00717.1 protein-disulfide reductase DsbD [Rhizobium sp. P38BS-XIX]
MNLQSNVLRARLCHNGRRQLRLPNGKVAGLASGLYLLLIACFIALGAGASNAADAPLAVNKAFQLSVDRETSGVLHLHWKMPAGYYLYREHLSATTSDGKPIALKTPQGITKGDQTFGKSEVYFDHADAEVDPVGGPLTVIYRGCQEHGLCYPSATRTIDTETLHISEQAAFTAPAAAQSKWTPAQPNSTPVLKPEPAGGATVASTNIVARFLARGGVLLLLAAFFGFGVLLAFTPCVFPLYPILAATLAREGEQLTARRGLLLSVSYAVALAAAFGIFGAVAGWTGENLQLALQSEWTVAAIAVIFALLALSMFGLYELQLPSGLAARLSGNRNGRSGSVTSAAILGFSSAFIIGPCVTAPLAGALLYVARTGDIVLGAALLFALGLGKGVPLVAFGTAGSKALPRAGAWMESVKQAFGFIFLGFAIWMAEPLLPDWLTITFWAIWAMACAIYLGAFDVARGRISPLHMASQALGLFLAVYAVALTVGLAAGATNPLMPLAAFGGGQKPVQISLEEGMTPVASKNDLDHQLDLAQSSGKASLVYFTADWCVSCRSIDRNVLTRADVAEALGPLKAIKVDLSSMTPAERDLMRSLDVVGPPTMMLFTADRHEINDVRLVGEFGANDLLKAIATAKSGS